MEVKDCHSQVSRPAESGDNRVVGANIELATNLGVDAVGDRRLTSLLINAKITNISELITTLIGAAANALARGSLPASAEASKFRCQPSTRRPNSSPKQLIMMEIYANNNRSFGFFRDFSLFGREFRGH